MEAKKAVGMWEEQPKAKGKTPTDDRRQPAKAEAKPAAKPTPPPPAPKFYNHTDLGNARRMVDAFGQDIIYVPDWETWFVWTGSMWSEDKKNHIMNIAKETVAKMYQDAATLNDDGKRQELIKWGLLSESRKRLADMVTLASSEPGIPREQSELDTHHMLLNCKNGTVDLATGELLPHTREHYITMCLPIRYNPTATCPTWLSFLNDIMLGDQQMVNFLQRAIGYTLTGNVTEQCLFFLYGTGSNGKSTFIETIMGLLGGYAQKAPTEMLMAKYGAPGIPNDVARLVGMRMVVAAELEEGKQFNESVIKDLTGDDTITARFMRQEFFDFPPTHKLWMYGNHKPVIKGTDEGIWRRPKLIPFLRKFDDHEKDKTMKARLRAEYEGILAWAVQGCLLWQRDGLTPPDQVKEATQNYRNEMDTMARFIEEKCFVSAAVSVRFSDLRLAYEQWCVANGLTAEGGRKFGASLTDRGFESYAGHSNVAMRRGIALIHEES